MAYPIAYMSRICTSSRGMYALEDIEESKDNLYIYAVSLSTDKKTVDDCSFKLQWRVAGGTWADLGSSGAIKYASSGTVLTNGNAVTYSEKCSSTDGSYTWIDGEEITDGVSGTISLGGTTNCTELQFSFDPSGCTEGSTYEFRLYNITADAVADVWSYGEMYSFIAHVPRTLYFVDHTNYGVWNHPYSWSLTSGGEYVNDTPRTNDTIIIDANSFPGSNKQLDSIGTGCVISSIVNLPSGCSLGLGGDLAGDVPDGFDYIKIYGGINTNNYNISARKSIWIDHPNTSGSYTYTLGTSTFTVTNAVYIDGTIPNLVLKSTGGTSVVDADEATFVVNVASSSSTEPILIYLRGIDVGSLTITMESGDRVDVNPYLGVTSAIKGDLSVTGDGNLRLANYTYAVTGGITLEGDTSGGLVIDQTSTLSKASGTVSAVNCTISHSTATGGATFKASLLDGNVNGGSNSGWLFPTGIAATSGAIEVTPSSITRGYILQTESKSLSLSGSSAELDFYHLAVGSKALALSGKAVSLEYSGSGAGTAFIELSQYNGAPIVDTFETFDEWIPGVGGSPAATGYDIGIGVGIIESHGIDVSLKTTRKIEAASKALEISGTAVGLNRNCPLPAAAGSVELTGTAVDLAAARKMAADSKALAVSGSAGVLLKSFPLAAAAGSAALSGTAVSFVVTRKITVAAGALAETGQAVSLARTALMAAASGSVALTGTDVSLTTERGLSIASGAFVVTGTSVIFNGERHFAISSGAFTQTGQAVGLSVTRKVAAATKAFTLSGQSISLLGDRKISAEAGSLSETGDGIDLLTDRRISALFGAEIVSGSEVGLKRFAKLLVGAGAFNFTGTDVEILTLGIRPQVGHFLISGSDVTFLKARGVWVQTVFSHAAGRNTVSAEKVRRATAQPRITGV